MELAASSLQILIRYRLAHSNPQPLGGGSLLIGSPYQNTKVIQYAWCWATLGKHDNLRSRNYTKSLPGTLFGTSIPTFSGQMGLTRLVLDSHVEGLENSLDKVSNTLVKFGMLKRGFYNV